MTSAVVTQADNLPNTDPSTIKSDIETDSDTESSQEDETNQDSPIFFKFDEKEAETSKKDIDPKTI